MAVKLAPQARMQFLDSNGDPYSGAQVFFYAAGSTTKQDTYTDSTGNTANDNPMTLNARGETPNPVWFTEGLNYKMVLAPAGDTDPPASPIRTDDNLSGVNDANVTVDQWVASGLTPTYVSATSFTVEGDQTTAFHVGRRLKTTNSGGTIYSRITAVAYTSLTTVTVANDSGSLDAGLSAVSYGLLTADNPSIPACDLPDTTTATTQSATNRSTRLATTAFVGSQHHNAVQDFRLTLTSGTPVTTSDVTGATTVYATPFKGNAIGLYDGTNWCTYYSAEMSLALGTITDDNGYDVFCYINSGTPTLELLAWTNNTTRATALAYQDGILVKSGDATRRYLGSFLTTSTTTTEDSLANRNLFNYYHQMPRHMEVTEDTASWTYTTATWRQARAQTDNQIGFFVGVLEQRVSASLVAWVGNSSGGRDMKAGLGLNSTSAPSGMTGGVTNDGSGSEDSISVTNQYLPVLGKNYIAWLEYSEASGASTWYGDSGEMQSGINGVVLG